MRRRMMRRRRMVRRMVMSKRACERVCARASVC